MTLLDLLPLVAIAAAFWLLLIRPAQRRRRDQDQLVASLAPGQRIMTTAGVFGTLTSIDDDVVVLAIAPGVEIEMLAVAVARVVPTEDFDLGDPPAADTADAQDSADDPGTDPRGEADRG